MDIPSTENGTLPGASSLDRIKSSAREKAQTAIAASKTCVQENPLALIAVAFGAGLLIGAALMQSRHRPKTPSETVHDLVDDIASQISKRVTNLAKDLPSASDLFAGCQKAGKKLGWWKV